ncbi:MAG: hypothetical protein CMB99_04350 [Flavobacteriaceae bacterium]|nr:hypothetical protein [Flavobacteriaceae bacterium]
MTLVSCDKLPLVKKSKLKQLDTVVNFSSVDLSPSFPECNSIIEKQKKSDCFRRTIHQKIGMSMAKHELESVFDIDETIKVDLLVSAEGEIALQSIHNSDELKENLPELDSIIRLCISDLPKVLPATKRGIPVATQYQLPIKIRLEN